MNGRGGCCIARYGGYGGRYGLSKADRIMLRFRPIAPKPPCDGGGASPGPGKYGSSTTNSGGSSSVSGKYGRGKRKYQKDSSGGNPRKCNRRKVSDGVSDTKTSVTLSLLPETPDDKRPFQDLNVSPVVENDQKRNGPLWLSFSGGDGGMLTTYKSAEISRRTVVVSSCVTVERVTDAWIDGHGLGRTDEEKKMSLVRDTCPGFVSDGAGRVTWTNEAYKKMAKEDVMEEGAPERRYDNFHVNVKVGDEGEADAYVPCVHVQGETTVHVSKS